MSGISGIQRSLSTTSVNNINTLAESHKTNSVANAIADIKSSNNLSPLKGMEALSTNGFSNPSGKLTDTLRQELQELVKTPSQQSIVVERFFSEHMIPLLKSELNKSFNDEQLKQHVGLPVDQPIDDNTLVKHFLNGTELKGKLERFDNAMNSYQTQKITSAKEFHLNEAFRALEESVELLWIPGSPSANNEPASAYSTEPKQPTASTAEVNDNIPAQEFAKPHIPTKSGDVHYHTHYHFGDNISRVSTDKEPVKVDVTVHVNGADATSTATAAFSEKAAQQEPSAFAETQNTASHELNHQQNVKDEVPEKKTPVMQDASTETLSAQQDGYIQLDDVIDGFISNDGIPSKEIEEYTKPDKTTVKEQPEQPLIPLSRFQSESALNGTGGYKKGADGKWTKEEQPFSRLSRSQSEGVLNDTGGYKKGTDGKWTKEKLHSKTDVVLSQGATQSNNIAGKKAYSLSDVRGNDMDRANEAKAGNTLTVDLNINMDDNGNVEPEIQGVNISVSPEKSSFSLNRRSVGQQSSLKRSFSANDVQTADSSNINKLTGQPFKYSVSVDDRVILTRDAQVQSLSRKNSYIEGDTRFGAKTDKASS